MEKYAKLMKGLEMCAGPECCKDGCPYYGETTGGTTCRARLLLDASVAIVNERSSAVAALQDREAAEKENDVLRECCREKDKLCQECEGLKEYALALEKEGQQARAEKDKLREELAMVNDKYRQMTTELSRLHADVDDLEAANNNYRTERDKLAADNMELRKECDMLATRCTVLQNEANALLLKMGGKHDGKTNQPSVSDDALKSEYKRGYLDAMEYCFRELCKRVGGGCRHE